MNKFTEADLFFDIEDEGLRTRNRAVLMSNITEMNITDNGISSRGVQELSEYFKLVPIEERAKVWIEYVSAIERLGIQTHIVVKQAAA